MTEMFSAVQGQLNEVEADSPKGEDNWGTTGELVTWNNLDIYAACKEGNLGVVLLLWYKGVSVSTRDANNATPLHQAAYNGHPKVCRFLVEQGAEIDAANSWDATPLMWASNAGHFDVIKYLVRAGADPSKTDSKGYNSLYHACHGGHTHIMHWYFSNFTKDKLNGAALDGDGHNLFQWACYKGFLGAARYLNEVQRADCELIDKEGRTALHWACRQGHSHIVEYLLSLNLKRSIDHRDNEGLTPAETAVTKMHPHLASLVSKAAVSKKPQPFGSGREESTLALALNNPYHLRRALYAMVVVPFFVLAVTPHVHILAALLLLPVAAMLPPALDGVMYRRGQPPVRTVAVPTSGTMCGMTTQATLLAVGAERNLYTAVLVFLTQLVVPGLFFHSEVGQYTATWSPTLHTAIMVLSSAGMFFYLVAGSRRARGPEVSDPTTVVDTPGAYCFEVMQKKSLRSVYCPLVHRVVGGFDHFSVATDSAIGLGNRGYFMLWTLCCCLWSGAIAFSAVMWGLHISPAGVSYTTCRVIGRLLVTGFPGGDPTATSVFFPSRNQYLQFWTCVVPLFVFVLAVERFVTQLALVSAAATQEESQTPDSVPVTGAGSVQSSFASRKGKAVSVYSKGSYLTNFTAWLSGADSRYNTIVEVGSMQELQG